MIVSGNLTVMLDGKKLFKSPRESIFIPLGSKHWAWNETEDIVVFIEVKAGTYLVRMIF